jgi:hypothetical protein
MLIKDLKSLTSKLDIDWVKINNQLLLKSEITGNEKILVKNSKALQNLAKFIETVDKK